LIHFSNIKFPPQFPPIFAATKLNFFRIRQIRFFRKTVDAIGRKFSVEFVAQKFAIFHEMIFCGTSFKAFFFVNFLTKFRGKFYHKKIFQL